MGVERLLGHERHKNDGNTSAMVMRELFGFCCIKDVDELIDLASLSFKFNKLLLLRLLGSFAGFCGLNFVQLGISDTIIKLNFR